MFTALSKYRKTMAERRAHGRQFQESCLRVNDRKTGF